MHATILTLFGFSKALDYIYHTLVLVKFKSGFTNDCVNWVKLFWTDRRQWVKGGNDVLGWRPVTQGIQRESVPTRCCFSLVLVTKLHKNIGSKHSKLRWVFRSTVAIYTLPTNYKTWQYCGGKHVSRKYISFEKTFSIMTDNNLGW